MPKPRSILFDHVACGVRRMDVIAVLLERELGGTPHRGGPGQGFRGAQWAFDGDGRLELIEPDDEPGGFLHRFLDSRGPGIHHVTFKVPDLHAARDRAGALGFDVVGFNDEHPEWKECFLRPKQAGGIVVQMAEVDPDVDSDNWVPIAAVTSGPPVRTTSLRGLRLVSRDHANMRRCWVDLFGATVEVTRGAGSMLHEETFRWAGCPLALRVLADPGADIEGPVALEFAAFGAAFPADLPQLLGVTLLQIDS